jgi:hypothetical protein
MSAVNVVVGIEMQKDSMSREREAYIPSFTSEVIARLQSVNGRLSFPEEMMKRAKNR